MAGGAATGALYDDGIGLLIGLGALAIPGVGPAIVGGALVAALFGAGVGATAGSLIGALTDIGVHEEEAQYYAQGIRYAGTPVTGDAPDETADRAASIMRSHGAADTGPLAVRYRESGRFQ